MYTRAYSAPSNRLILTLLDRSILAALCAIGLFCWAHPAKAAVAPLTFQPNPVDLNDLDHHQVYTWRIDNINLTNISVTGASLTFNNIENWDSNPNMLFVWMLDTAIGSGVRSAQDVDPNQAPVVDIVDAFLSPLTSLVANGTAKTKLVQKSFTTTPTTYTYNFTTAQLATLTSYITNGNNLAFGFDPDCHFFNDGISFTMNITPVPEAEHFIPVAVLLVGAVVLEIRRRRRARA